MNYLANLQQLLDFYRKNGGGRGQPAIPLQGGGYQSDSGEIVPGLTWAQGAMQQGQQQGPQDFFGDEPQQNVLKDYVRPRQEGAGMMPQRPMMDRIPPQRINRNTSMRGRSDNILARLMGGQGGY
jgi:hypothetical protein